MKLIPWYSLVMLLKRIAILVDDMAGRYSLPFENFKVLSFQILVEHLNVHHKSK